MYSNFFTNHPVKFLKKLILLHCWALDLIMVYQYGILLTLFHLLANTRNWVVTLYGLTVFLHGLWPFFTTSWLLGCTCWAQEWLVSTLACQLWGEWFCYFVMPSLWWQHELSELNYRSLFWMRRETCILNLWQISQAPWR